MAERKSRYKEIPGKYGKAQALDDVNEELKKEEPVEEKPKKKAKRKGIVNTNALNVRSEASDKVRDNIICVIRSGATVIINDLVGVPEGWLNITTEPTKGIKVTGFVMSKYIKEV
mgnify:CR=1 FL=1